MQIVCLPILVAMLTASHVPGSCLASTNTDDKTEALPVDPMSQSFFLQRLRIG